MGAVEDTAGEAVEGAAGEAAKIEKTVCQTDEAAEDSDVEEGKSPMCSCLCTSSCLWGQLRRSWQALTWPYRPHFRFFIS